MENSAILIIDMLNDFVTGELKCERAEHIISNLKRLIQDARRNDIPVIYINDAHRSQDFEVVRRWGKHAIKGTRGAKVIPELRPAKEDYIIDKTTYSGFYETGLDPLLRSLYKGEGVRTIILGGLHTNICVRHTAADAFFRGYNIIIVKDGVEALTQEDHKQGLKYLKDVYTATVIKVEDIVKDFT